MKTLVIIDDEIFFRKSLINFLEKQNIYNIAGEANNGQAGIQLIENVKPDIALVDISMPVMSGLDMIAALGTDCHTRFILSTGYEDFDYAKKAISLQVRGYLLKPLDHRELMETLQKVSDEIDQENSKNSYVNNYFQFRDLYTRQMQLNFFQKVISGTPFPRMIWKKFRFIKLPVILPFLWRSTVPIRKYGMKKVIFLCSTLSWKIYAEKSYSLCAKSLFTLTILR